MLEQISEAARKGHLTTRKCIDNATGAEVEVLCVKLRGNAIRPIARIYADVQDANADVSPGGEAIVLKTLLH